MEELTGVFLRAREALSHHDNDFAWSSWNGPADAVREIDEIIAKLRAGSLPDRFQMEVLFAATGPIQEVSLSSGWAQGFLKLAEDFDAALRRVQP
ncbi:MAG: hypothetical protein WDM79_02140 [Terricaulis sp.]